MAELSGVLDEHCATVGRDPGEIDRSVQVVAESTEDMAGAVEQYAKVGVTDLVLILRGDNSVEQAERTAAMLPRLRTVA